MCASVLADLPGRLVAITSTCTTKSKHFDENKTHKKSNFENEFLEMVLKLLEEIIIY